MRNKCNSLKRFWIDLAKILTQVPAKGAISVELAQMNREEFQGTGCTELLLPGMGVANTWPYAFFFFSFFPPCKFTSEINVFSTQLSTEHKLCTRKARMSWQLFNCLALQPSRCWGKAAQYYTVPALDSSCFLLAFDFALPLLPGSCYLFRVKLGTIYCTPLNSKVAVHIETGPREITLIF